MKFVLLAVMLLPGSLLADSADVAAALASRTPLSYAQAWEKATREKKDIVIWVGVARDVLAESQINAVHVHVGSLEGSGAARVLVGCYSPFDGKLWCLEYLCHWEPADLARQLQKVRASISPTARTYSAQSSASWGPSFSPSFRSGGGSSC